MTQPNNYQRFRFQLIAVVCARIVVNTMHRLVYPFMPAFSRGLNVPIEVLAGIVSVRGGLGMIAPLFGSIPDRWGRRRAMLGSLTVFTLALLLAALFPNLYTLIAVILLTMMTKFIFDPAWQAYMSERVPYTQRGLVVALTEIGWSGAVLVGVPLAGFLIDRGQWHSAFAPLAVASFIVGLGIWLIIPVEHLTKLRESLASEHNNWQSVWRNPSAIGALALGVILSFANENFNSVYGRWLESAFNVSIAQLGLSVTIIAASEVIGEGLVAGLADRVGKRVAIMVGLALSALANFALPFASGNLFFALGAIFFVYLTFEFTIVTTIPLNTELVPHARARMMTASIAAHSTGRMLGVLCGTWLWQYGFFWNGMTAAVLNIIGLAVVWWVVKENKE